MADSRNNITNDDYHLNKIMLSKTASERASIAVEITQSFYNDVKKSIVDSIPGISNGELVAMIFERYNANDFTAEKLAEIKQAIIDFHNKKDNESSS